MASGNAGQVAYWNGPIGQVWAREQEKRDREHAAITDATLAFAAVQPGEHALDIGCGTGTTTLRLAEQAGAKGGALGVDISKPMIEVARHRAREQQSRARFLEADASEHRFEPHAFDLAFSQFGIMFFTDPVAAFANIRRALPERGRVVFACWRSAPENPWAHVPETAARPFLPPAPPSDPNAPGRYAFADQNRVRGILLQAGFQAPELRPFDTPAFLGRTPAEAAESTIESGPLMRTLADADAETRRMVREGVETRLAQEMSSRGIVLTQAVWLVRARA